MEENNCVVHVKKLDVKFHSARASNVLRIGSQCLLDGTARATILVNNVHTTTNVQLCLEHAIKLIPDGLEEVVALDARNEIIRFTLWIRIISK